jgi:phage protein D
VILHHLDRDEVRTQLPPDIKRYAPDFDIEINGKIQKELRRNSIRITVEDSIEVPSTFNLELYEKYDSLSGSFKWLDSDILDPVKARNVKIYIKYASSSVKSLNPIFSGLIVALNPSFPSSGIPSLSVQGYDRSFLLQRPGPRTDYAAEENLAAIIAKVARRSGLKFDQVQGPRIKPKAKLSVDPQESDYTYLRNMANRFGYEFFIREDTLYFREPPYREKELMSLAWGREIISFSPRMSSAGIISKATVSGYCHKNNANHTISESATQEDLDFKERNAVSAAKALSSGSQGGSSELLKHNCPIDNIEEAKKMARAILMKSNYNFIEGSCECIGLPEARAGTNIIIDNIGKKFNGKYYVKKAIHSIGDGGYTTTLEVCRGGYSSA